MTLHLHRCAPSVLWLFLIGATGLSLMSSESERLSVTVATTLIMLIAYIKSRLVLLHFMRVRDAPVAWRLLLELWLIAAIGMILIYARAG